LARRLLKQGGMKLCLLPSLAILVFSSACNAPRTEPPSPKPAVSVAPVTPSTLRPAAAPVPAAPVVNAVTLTGGSTAVAAHAGAASALSPRQVAESSLKVKRFVVAAGVKDREPLVSRDPLPADGSAIYAFVELANPLGESENVRITFERHGSSERVGEVTLPVPGNTARHRTWAFTRFIRTAGVWDAVLWSENGTELGRTSFEIKPA